MLYQGQKILKPASEKQFTYILSDILGVDWVYGLGIGALKNCKLPN